MANHPKEEFPADNRMMDKEEEQEELEKNGNDAIAVTRGNNNSPFQPKRSAGMQRPVEPERKTATATAANGVGAIIIYPPSPPEIGGEKAKDCAGSRSGSCTNSSSDSCAAAPDAAISIWCSPMHTVEYLQIVCIDFLDGNRDLLRPLVRLALLLMYHLLLVVALLRDFHRAFNLALFTSICWLFVLLKRGILPLWRRARKQRKEGREEQNKSNAIVKLLNALRHNWFVVRLEILALLVPLLFILWDCRNNPRRLSGLAGFAFFLIVLSFCSHKPTKVNWRPVIWGFLLQFIFGIIVLRWEWGERRFVDFSNLAIDFMEYTTNGTDFVYGFLSSPPNICGIEPVMAFRVLQVIIYVGAVVSVLYFYGIIQAVVKQMALFMQWTMGTTATESLNACACVLLGNAESPLLIRPYIEKMTASELHAIMTTGFSCIAGSVFAVFISFGACPRYLLSAAVMGAPGSLACSKLMYPETEESNTKNVTDLKLAPSHERNAMEAISAGSYSAVSLVTAVLANLITFVALMAFASGVLNYVGTLLGYPDWTLEMFFGYAFAPIAYMIGVTDSVDQALIVGRLLGVKIAASDFIAYKRLGDVLALLSPRSAMIATYALCSFSNFIGAGIQMAVLSEMAPSKRQLISKLVMRALLAGCISTFMSAAIAGILVEDPVLCKPSTGHASGQKCFDLSAHQTFMEQISAQLNLTTNNGATKLVNL